MSCAGGDPAGNGPGATAWPGNLGRRCHLPPVHSGQVADSVPRTTSAPGDFQRWRRCPQEAGSHQCHQCPMAEAVRWPHQGHTLPSQTVGWELLGGAWLFQWEDPIPASLRQWGWNNLSPNQPQCLRAMTLTRKGGGGTRPLCNPISSVWAPLLLLHLFIDPPWENLSSAGLAGALLMRVEGREKGRGG